MGETTITAKINGGDKLTVQVSVAPSLVSKKTVTAGGKVQLEVKGAGGSKVTWSSGDRTVARVSKSGVVTAGKKAGKTTITAKCGEYTLECVLTVKQKAGK